jgi:translocation and assembly module TamB
VEPDVDLDVIATLGERLLDSRFSLRSAALALDGQGRVDLGQSRIGNMRVDARLLQPGALAPMCAGATSGCRRRSTGRSRRRPWRTG